MPVIRSSFVTLLTSALLSSSCGSDPDSSDPDAGDFDGDVWVEPSCGASQSLAFVTTDYGTGSAGLASLVDGTSRTSLVTLHADAVVTCACGRVVVVERLGGDNLTVLTAAELTPLAQHALGPRSNPHDLVIANGGTGLVSLYGEGAVVSVDLESGRELERVVLPESSDPDGNPEPSMLRAHKGSLFVTLQRLDRRAEPWTPSGLARIARLELNPLEHVATIELEGSNPTTELVPGAEEGIFYIGHAGSWEDQSDGGLERVDLDAGQSLGMVLDGAALGGNIIDLAIVSETLGYVTVNRPGVADDLLSFDPSSGEVSEPLLSTTAYAFVDVELSAEGLLLIADRNFNEPGIRVLDAETGLELPFSPIETGLPPFSMCLLPELEG